MRAWPIIPTRTRSLNCRPRRPSEESSASVSLRFVASLAVCLSVACCFCVCLARPRTLMIAKTAQTLPSQSRRTQNSSCCLWRMRTGKRFRFFPFFPLRLFLFFLLRAARSLESDCQAVESVACAHGWLWGDSQVESSAQGLHRRK